MSFLWTGSVLINCSYYIKLHCSYSSNFNCSYSSNFKCSCSSNFNYNFLWTRGVLIKCSYYIKLQLFSFVELQVFLFVKLRLFLLLWTSSILIATNFNCAYCIKLNFLFTSLYPVSRVYTSRLWTLQLWMPLLILILWLCLPNILKESSPNFLIFCINLFTTSTIDYFAENSKEKWTFCVYCEPPPIL